MRLAMLISTFCVVALTACQSLSDVKTGRREEGDLSRLHVRAGVSAAVKVAGEHFEIQKQSKEEGIILGERRYTFVHSGAWVGIL